MSFEEDETEETVDFEAVKRNIWKDHLDITLIRVIYKGLTAKEVGELKKKQSAEDLKNGKMLATYPSDFTPLYQDKAVGILYLGA